MKKRMLATVLVAAFFSMPSIANAVVVDTNTYLSFDEVQVPANQSTVMVAGVRTSGTFYYSWGSRGWVACNGVEVDWPFPPTCPAVPTTVYSCSNGSQPDSDHNCLINSASGKMKISPMVDKVKNFLGNLLPIVAGFLLLSIAIFLALKTVRRYGKKLL
jgi:hypothetical protein